MRLGPTMPAPPRVLSWRGWERGRVLETRMLRNPLSESVDSDHGEAGRRVSRDIRSPLLS